MGKLKHEIRDPIHGFVKILDDERKILNSEHLQRLRDITQLGMTYLLYPSATHKRFEHSLGVMELATRVFDVIIAPDNLLPQVLTLLPELKNEDAKRYWRKVLRMAALCHDIGHLPFSHTGEKEIFPEGWNHERMTAELIQKRMAELFRELDMPLRWKDVVKVALGQKKIKEIHPDWEFSRWEIILSEIIVSDIFGVDRMDYLLRDSYHIGVAYGKFDHFRLIDTLRILPNPETDEPELGIEIGGMHVAESLLLSRYFMYSQVYLHHIRRIYDIHLKEFLKAYFTNKSGKAEISVDPEEFLNYTDSMIMSEIYTYAKNQNSAGYEHAKRITQRKHFKLVYERNAQDISINPNAVEILFTALQKEFGEENITKDEHEEKGGISPFWVIDRNKNIVNAFSESEVLKKIPRAIIGFIFAKPELKQRIKQWLDENKEDILKKGVKKDE